MHVTQPLQFTGIYSRKPILPIHKEEGTIQEVTVPAPSGTNQNDESLWLTDDRQGPHLSLYNQTPEELKPALLQVMSAAMRWNFLVSPGHR